MNKLCFSLSLVLLAGLSVTAQAKQQNSPIRAPAPGVLCDRYICANDKGVSRKLTERYVGRKAAARLFSHGNFDTTQFTFVSGIFCDVKERLCRVDRYYDGKGQRSAVSTKYTKLLFGK